MSVSVQSCLWIATGLCRLPLPRYIKDITRVPCLRVLYEADFTYVARHVDGIQLLQCHDGIFPRYSPVKWLPLQLHCCYWASTALLLYGFVVRPNDVSTEDTDDAGETAQISADHVSQNLLEKHMASKETTERTRY